jgi:hypothetical protein
MQTQKQGTCGTYSNAVAALQACSAVKEHTPIERETIINNLDEDNL